MKATVKESAEILNKDGRLRMWANPRGDKRASAGMSSPLEV